MKRIIKWTTIPVVVAAIVAAAMYAVPAEVTYTTSRQSVVASSTTAVQNIIDQAKKSDVEIAEEMLREATQKLDAEEARLNAEIADLEARVDKINTIRASF